MIVVTALIFVGLLLALVLVHEWGHFIAAKRAGCNVEEFGFGFPPRVWSVMYHGTRYSLNLLPIGGFVKIEGEDMQDPNPGPTSFGGKSARWRIVILAAGVTMNVVLAAVLFSWQGIIGFPTLITEDNSQTLTDHHTYILEIAPGSPAAEADIEPLDRIVRFGDLADPTLLEVQEQSVQRAGTPVEIEVDRQGKREVKSVTPRTNPPEGEGALGVSLAATGLQKVSWWQAPAFGITRTGNMLVAIVKQFGVILRRLVSEGNVGETLTGPVGIAIYTNEATKLGLSYILEFGALISLNLAIINILPLPALDGGRIVFVLLEKLRGQRLPAKIEQVTHTVGFVLLIGLMILITLRDINRFF